MNEVTGLDRYESNNEGGTRAPHKTKVVDVHTHIFPSGMLNAARSSETWHGLEMALTPDGHISWTFEGRTWVHPWANPGESLEGRLAAMDSFEVDAHILSLTPTLYRFDWPVERFARLARESNEFLAEAAREYPTRLQGLAVLPLQDPAAAVAELEHCVSQLGLVGAVIGTHVAGVDWDDPALFAVLEAAQQLDVMLLVHPTQARFPGNSHRYHLRNVIGNPLETTIAFAAFAFGGVFDRLPSLRLCLAHGGGYVCQGTGRMDHAGRVRSGIGNLRAVPSEYAKSVYFDSLTHSAEALRFIARCAGTDRVVLGSDYPADMGDSNPVRSVKSAFPDDPNIQDAILGGNAMALIGDRGKSLLQDRSF